MRYKRDKTDYTVQYLFAVFTIISALLFMRLFGAVLAIVLFVGFYSIVVDSRRYGYLKVFVEKWF